MFTRAADSTPLIYDHWLVAACRSGTFTSTLPGKMHSR